MPDELDEYSEPLVTNPFADYSHTLSHNNSHHGCGHVAIPLDFSSDHHPLVPPACLLPNIPFVTASQGEGETQPWLTSTVSLDVGSSSEAGKDRTAGRATGMPSRTILHPVGPNDSLAGVALRYGISIAALRRANQLWPSDPIHLRTELSIPRGDASLARPKPPSDPGTSTPLRSAAKPVPDMSHDLVASSFVAVRDIIFSVIPARISLDSLSSKATVSEDLELDDLGRAKTFAVEPPFSQDGHELSILVAPHEQHELPDVMLSQRFPCTTPTENQHTSPSRIPKHGNSHSQLVMPSSSILLERPSRKQPFAILPVRTSQLEPEPAMELPARNSRI